MIKKQVFELSVIEYGAFSELSLPHQELLLAAKEATSLAYAPYSNFRVGAALLLSDNTIVLGANQENAAYSMCLCAERTALAAAAMQYPSVFPTAIAITAQSATQKLSQPVSPCGACRQVLAETEARFGQSITVLMQGETGVVWEVKTAKALLPLSFDGSLL
jgi:cytidine deaminase